MSTYMLEFFIIAKLSTMGDTQQSSDMFKRARHFFIGSQMCVNGDFSFVSSKSYIEEVVKEISNDEWGEWPICLEWVDDAIMAYCVHHMCHQCLLSSWCSSLGGGCIACAISS